MLNIIKFVSVIICSLILSCSLWASDVKFSFQNATITTDAGVQYYEADVLISSQTTTGAFYMSSGQIYLNYNEAAFGQNISANNNMEIEYPSSDYLLNLKDNVAGVLKVYSDPVINDNTTSRLSVAWQQDRAGNCISIEITDTPVALFHLKLKYMAGAESEAAGICFETGSVFVNQTYTICGDLTGTCTYLPADCVNFPGALITNEQFDCSGANVCGSLQVNAGGTQQICAGESITLGASPTASGGNGNLSYSWSPTTGLSDASIANPTVTPSANITYTLTVLDDFNCEVTQAAMITVNPLPSLTYNVTLASGTSAADGVIELIITNGTAPFNPVWADGGTGIIRSDLTPGIYDVEIFDANNCSTSASITVGMDSSTDIEEVEWLQVMSIFPNPVNELMTLQVESERPVAVNFEIVDVLGRVLISEAATIEQGSNSFEIKTKRLSNGKYFLQITLDGEDALAVEPFVKVKD